MIISKDITVGQAALLGTLMRYLPSEFYVENGKLNKVREEGGRARGGPDESAWSALGHRSQGGGGRRDHRDSTPVNCPITRPRCGA